PAGQRARPPGGCRDCYGPKTGRAFAWPSDWVEGCRSLLGFHFRGRCRVDLYLVIRFWPFLVSFFLQPGRKKTARGACQRPGTICYRGFDTPPSPAGKLTAALYFSFLPYLAPLAGPSPPKTRNDRRLSSTVSVIRF